MILLFCAFADRRPENTPSSFSHQKRSLCCFSTLKYASNTILQICWWKITLHDNRTSRKAWNLHIHKSAVKKNFTKDNQTSRKMSAKLSFGWTFFSVRQFPLHHTSPGYLRGWLRVQAEWSGCKHLPGSRGYMRCVPKHSRPTWSRAPLDGEWVLKIE